LNELFWSEYALKNLRLEDGSKFVELPLHQRYASLSRIAWKKSLKKTFYERRTPFHVFVNFLPLWILHVSVFYLYLSIVVQISPRQNLQLTFIGCGGLLSVLISMASLVGELAFVPKHSFDILIALVFGFALLVVNAGIPTVQFLFFRADKPGSLAKVLSFVQILISGLTTIVCLAYPRLRRVKAHAFTSDFAVLSSSEARLSKLFWLCVFCCKLVASFFYLVQPLFYPVQAIVVSIGDCKSLLCRTYGYSLLTSFLTLNLILFMLDSYIWYIQIYCFWFE
jgi:1,3-beta-glucan synthase